MSGTIIPFSEIPNDWRVPSTVIEARPVQNNRGVFAWPGSALILGQMLVSQNAGQNIPYPVFRAADAVALFGAGSQAATMAGAFLAANPYTPLTVIGLADPVGGSKATGTLTFTVAPSLSGVFAFYIAGTRVPLSVTPVDTITTMATRMAAAINALPDLPVVATSAAGVVTVTAKHAGEIGNGINLDLNLASTDALPLGMNFSLVSNLSGGTLQPDIATAISAMTNLWFTDVALPSFAPTNTAALVAEAERRYTAQIEQDMHLYVGLYGTYSGLTTATSGYNSKVLTPVNAQNSSTPTWIVAAVSCAVASLQLTNDPARQLRGLTLPGVTAPAPSRMFIDSERDGLLRSGVSTCIVTRDGAVALERLITTYRQTTTGVADLSWLDIMTVATVSRIRHDWRQYVRLTYPRSKLAPNGAPAAETDPSVVTPQSMANAWAARCKVYAANGWIQNEQVTIPQAVFVINGSDPNRMDARLVIQVMGNLMVFAAALEFSR
jgi:phage tail sheath gpL-like